MNRRRVSSRGRGPPTRRRRPPKMRITRAASKTQRHIRFQDRSRLFATWPTPAGRRTPKRRPRRPKGQGLFAGWVRGWGLGGTPSGVGCPTPSAASGSGPIKLFFWGCRSCCGAPGGIGSDPFRAAAERSAARRETPDNANGYGDGHCCRQTLPPRTVCRPETVPEADVRADP